MSKTPSASELADTSPLFQYQCGCGGWAVAEFPARAGQAGLVALPDEMVDRSVARLAKCCSSSLSCQGRMCDGRSCLRFCTAPAVRYSQLPRDEGAKIGQRLYKSRQGTDADVASALHLRSALHRDVKRIRIGRQTDPTPSAVCTRLASRFRAQIWTDSARPALHRVALACHQGAAEYTMYIRAQQSDVCFQRLWLLGSGPRACLSHRRRWGRSIKATLLLP